jgi:hypothetical protein
VSVYTVLQLRRALLSAYYGKFRRASVANAIRKGCAVIAAIAWPTEDDEDLQHYVTVAACDDSLGVGIQQSA